MRIQKFLRTDYLDFKNKLRTLPINNYLIIDKTTFKQEISAYTARGGKMTIVKLWL